MELAQLTLIHLVIKKFVAVELNAAGLIVHGINLLVIVSLMILNGFTMTHLATIEQQEISSQSIMKVKGNVYLPWI